MSRIRDFTVERLEPKEVHEYVEWNKRLGEVFVQASFSSKKPDETKEQELEDASKYVIKIKKDMARRLVLMGIDLEDRTTEEKAELKNLK